MARPRSAQMLLHRCCSSGFKINHFFNKIFQFVKNKEAFCIFNEVNLQNTGKIKTPEDSQIQWEQTSSGVSLKRIWLQF